MALDPAVPGTIPTVYREYAPAPALRPWLVCAWTLEVGNGGDHHRQRVLPDGCADIVWIGEVRPLVVGPMTHASLATLQPRTSLVGLRFRPEVAAAVLHADAGELTDRDVPLDLLWAGGTARDASARLREARTPEARAAAAQDFLGARRTAFGAPDPVVRHAVSLLASPGRRIGRLADEVGLSERQLNRRFQASVGYSPKVFQRILRFQRLLALAQRGGAIQLGRMAFLAGYADQAHMTREVSEFADTTPSLLLGRADSALAGSDLLP
ncbi:MAG: DUF6597 domain-containing transcriptional factor [Gemmatimonadales bacterium]